MAPANQVVQDLHNSGLETTRGSGPARIAGACRDGRLPNPTSSPTVAALKRIALFIATPLLVAGCCENPGRDAPNLEALEEHTILSYRLASGLERDLSWDRVNPMSYRDPFSYGGILFHNPDELTTDLLHTRVHVPGLETRGLDAPLTADIALDAVGATLCACEQGMWSSPEIPQCVDDQRVETGDTAECIHLRGQLRLEMQPVECCGGSQGCYICAQDAELEISITGALEPEVEAGGTIVWRQDYGTAPAGCSALIDDD